jgi:hypothetical protein
VVHDASGVTASHTAQGRKGVRCPGPPRGKPAAVPARDENGRRLGLPTAIERWVLERDRHQCVRCGRRHALELHHIVEVCDGGLHDPDNLDTLCYGCHTVITDGLLGDMTYEEWKSVPSGATIELFIARSRRDTPDGAAMRLQLSSMTAEAWISLLQMVQDDWKKRP